jgi:two-component system, OmpR family, response regulator
MRILIVEDDIPLAKGLQQALVSNGYVADHAASGEAALDVCMETFYDLLVLDLGLPGMDGFELLRRLDPMRRGAVLILSARDGLEQRVFGLDLGADDYLSKPFALQELEARVRALLRRSQAQQGGKLRLGRITVDTLGRRAWVGDEPLDLTAREWGVLQYLLLRPGQVVGKGQLLQALCNWEKHLSDNAIEVYVSRLRAKLQDAGLSIRTLRGFGYIIEELHPVP